MVQCTLAARPLQGSRLSARQIMLMCLLIALGKKNQTIAQFVGASAETVRCWKRDLKRHAR
jgi:DNA-binding NarL/FixJ family response regulator